MHPFFSIIIPVYNRKKLIGRALESCLVQDYRDFEIIVVDDQSTDGTGDAVHKYHDPRIRVLRHEVNRGVCPARNTGMAAAKGEWVICLDSDDELLPGALRLIRERSRDVGDEIGGLRFMYELDGGGFSPEQPLCEDVWDYAAYIRWVQSCMHDQYQDSLICVRSSSCHYVSYPNEKMSELLYHLEFMKRYQVRVFNDVVAIIHSDAPDRLTRSGIRKAIADSRNKRKEYVLLFSNHGDEIQRLAPLLYQKMQVTYLMALLLAGDRLEGMKIAFSIAQKAPCDLRLWVVFMTGLMHPYVLAWTNLFQQWIRRRLRYAEN